ncbi:hypothetical protein L6452_01760 [Arctium lappa]|uniref:Uncharacterized protein n=1 Tax=Arctium lappa TaxID=4217 RepID=A0ACB9FIG1_ARCLA|nr:hypothetical protein L6452_01760 [Arctium lappa]
MENPGSKGILIRLITNSSNSVRNYEAVIIYVTLKRNDPRHIADRLAFSEKRAIVEEIYKKQEQVSNLSFSPEYGPKLKEETIGRRFGQY